jgi:WD40 repeat protein
MAPYFLAGSEDEEAVLWDAATGKIVHTFPAEDEPVAAAAFTRDGRHLVICAPGSQTIELWDVAARKKVNTIRDAGHAYCVAVSPDPKTPRHVLTSRQGGLAVLWNVETGEKLREFQGHTGAVTAVAFSPDGGRAYTVSLDSTIRVWDTAAATELARLFNLADDEQWLTVTPEGYYDGSPEGCKRLA